MEAIDKKKADYNANLKNKEEITQKKNEIKAKSKLDKEQPNEGANAGMDGFKTPLEDQSETEAREGQSEAPEMNDEESENLMAALEEFQNNIGDVDLQPYAL